MNKNLSKSQIDRLGERLKENTSAGDIRYLDDYRRSFIPAYESILNILRDELQLNPTGRPAKSTKSIIEKLLRQAIRLTQIQDISGYRIVVSDIHEQNQILELLRQKLPETRIADRRINPSHGYRGVHLVPSINNRSVEIQIRTSLQHLWAEFSEKLADLYDPAIKYGGGPQNIIIILNTASDLVHRIESMEQSVGSVDEIVSLRKELEHAFLEAINSIA